MSFSTSKLSVEELPAVKDQDSPPPPIETSEPPPQIKKKKRTLLQRLNNSFWKRILSISYFPIFISIRYIDSSLGPRFLSIILIPVIYLDLVRRLIDFQEFKSIRKIMPPEFWRGLTPWRHYVGMIRNWQSTLATLVVADRLHLPRWASRIQVSGTPPDHLAIWGSRPVILVYMHTGGYALLRFWLRSRGIPAGAYVAGFPDAFKKPWQQAVFAKVGASHGLPNEPHAFSGPKQVREALRFLRPGRALTIALDSISDSSLIFQAGGKYPICLSSGIIRLAVLANAVVVPVSVRPQGLGQFRVRFGTPIPDECLDKDRPQVATQLLLTQLWPEIEREPGLLCWSSLHRLAARSIVNHHISYP